MAACALTHPARLGTKRGVLRRSRVAVRNTPVVDEIGPAFLSVLSAREMAARRASEDSFSCAGASGFWKTPSSRGDASGQIVDQLLFVQPPSQPALLLFVVVKRKAA